MHDLLIAQSRQARDTVAHHARIRLDTRARREFLDITDRVVALVDAAALHQGIVNVQTRHTTTGIIVNEYEPLLIEDLGSLLERFAPASVAYRHDDLSVRWVNLVPDERHNGHAHGQALVLRASECLNVVEGALDLGRWQRLFFVELDGGQPREVSVMLLGVRS